MSPRPWARFLRLVLSVLAGGAVLLAGCGSGKKKVRVFAADALAASFKEMKHRFERLHPDTEVHLDIEGSIMLARLVRLRRADVVALADYRLFEKILYPRHARWVAKFASTEIVLARTTASRYQDKVNAANWHEVLLRPDVTYAIADPSQDPCGYYTLLAWKLAEKHYGAAKGARGSLYTQLQAHCPRERVALNALKLISEFLSTYRVDYGFVYRSHARDLKLPFIALPREINLGDHSLAATYAQVHINAPTYQGGTETMTGTAIAFGITVPPDAPHRQGAQDFVRFVLSEAGQAVLRRSDFVPIAPARVPSWPDGTFPEFLAPDLVRPER